MVAFNGHSALSTSKLTFDNPNAVAPADRRYAADSDLNQSKGNGVTNKALTSNVAILTTAAAHGIAVGDQVAVSIGDAVFDGTFTTVTGTTGSTVKYAKTHADVTSASATGTVMGTDGTGQTEAYDASDYDSQPGVAAARAAGYPRQG